jgi:hypothetical protein
MRIANYCGNMEAIGDTALNLKELEAKICYQWPLALVLIKIELCNLRGEVEAKSILVDLRWAEYSIVL